MTLCAMAGWLYTLYDLTFYTDVTMVYLASIVHTCQNISFARLCVRIVEILWFAIKFGTASIKSRIDVNGNL